ncbi:MAG TPA: SRPBCC family protein [Pyrinomonadaceae bacterium]|nr:SRPBCC family protein [Pyrinomonadaceae bacterium]
MDELKLTQTPIAKAAMLIRQPVAKVFEAFIDPAITSRFWFTKSTGRLEPAKHITWTWEMYDISIEVIIKEIEPNKKIVLDWGNYGEMTTVEWIFTPYEGDATYVTITNSGFRGDVDKVMRDALDSTGGFTWVLAGLKALLEHNVELNAIADAFPEGLEH